MKKKTLEKRMAKYVKLGFSKAQLREIRKGFKNGLSIEQVDCYAKLENSSSSMRSARQDLEKKLKKDYVMVSLLHVHVPDTSDDDEEVLYDMAGLDGMDEWDDLDDDGDLED